MYIWGYDKRIVRYFGGMIFVYPNHVTNILKMIDYECEKYFFIYRICGIIMMDVWNRGGIHTNMGVIAEDIR